MRKRASAATWGRRRPRHERCRCESWRRGESAGTGGGVGAREEVRISGGWHALRNAYATSDGGWSCAAVKKFFTQLQELLFSGLRSTTPSLVHRTPNGLLTTVSRTNAWTAPERYGYHNLAAVCADHLIQNSTTHTAPPEFVNMAEPAVKKPRIEDSKVAEGHKTILIIDYGSQYTQLITRRCGAAVSRARSARLESRRLAGRTLLLQMSCQPARPTASCVPATPGRLLTPSLV